MSRAIRKYRFPFVCNSLTKMDTLRSILDILTFKKHKRSAQFQTMLGEFLGLPEEQLFLFGSGRMGVYTFLKSLRLKDDDEVIIAGYTCVVLTNAVKFAGCKARYVDIERPTLNIDTQQLLNSITPQTKVVIVPHNFGIVYEDIALIKATHPHLIVIEDAAHTFGSVDQNNRLCGTLGDAAFFSMEFSKPITTGIGGVFIVNNKDYLPAFTEAFENIGSFSAWKVFRIAITLITFSFTIWKRSNILQLGGFFILKCLGLIHSTSKGEVDGIMPEKYVVKLSPALAVFGYYQLRNIDRVNEQKRQIAAEYARYFEGFSDLTIYYSERYNFVRFPVVFNENVSKEKIRTIKDQAARKGYRPGTWFEDVIHPVGSYRYCYEAGDCPVGEQVSKSIINFPVNCNVKLNDKEINELKELFVQNGIR